MTTDRRQVSEPRPRRRRAAQLPLALVGCLLGLGRAGAEPYATASATALVQARPSAGLLTLYSGYRNHPLVDAEAVVWMGGEVPRLGLSDGERDGVQGDVLTVNVGVREPHGYGSARAGRLIIASGAIRPVHVDGLRVLARAPTGTSLEAFAGVPVDPHGSRAHDWIAGGRAGQVLLEERLALGVSYVHQRDAGMIENEELGADLSLQPLRRLWLRAVGSWDLTLHGLAAAQVQATLATAELTARVYAERRVAARLLPATSLFSTISDSAASELGLDGDYQLFPRLAVGGRAAAQWIGGHRNENSGENSGENEREHGAERGYRLSARSRLSLGADASGEILLELSRRGGFDAGYNAALLAVEQSLSELLRAHASGELVAADEPGGRGQVWPYLNVGLRYGRLDGLHVAAGLIARATPEHVRDVTALVRLGYRERAAP